MCLKPTCCFCGAEPDKRSLPWLWWLYASGCCSLAACTVMALAERSDHLEIRGFTRDSLSSVQGFSTLGTLNQLYVRRAEVVLSWELEGFPLLVHYINHVDPFFKPLFQFYFLMINMLNFRMNLSKCLLNTWIHKQKSCSVVACLVDSLISSRLQWMTSCSLMVRAVFCLHWVDLTSAGLGWQTDVSSVQQNIFSSLQ